MKKIINIFVKNLQLNLSIQPNSRLILTNSSGQDSIILCAFFFILQKQWQIEPILLYCNHLWQYDSIPITYHTGGVSYCLTSNYIYSTTVYPVRGEANARTWRYNVFERVTILTMSSSLLLAHTASDRIETFFLNITRGSGLNGLSTIQWERLTYCLKPKCFSEKRTKPCSLPSLREKFEYEAFFARFALIQTTALLELSELEQSEQNLRATILRPLLSLNRFEIQLFGQYLAWPIWSDTSNLTSTYRRNRVRLQILPLIRFYFNPKLDSCLLRSVRLANQENAYLEMVTQKLLQSVIKKATKQTLLSDRVFFQSSPFIYQQRIVKACLELLGYKFITYQTIHYIVKVLNFNRFKSGWNQSSSGGLDNAVIRTKGRNYQVGVSISPQTFMTNKNIWIIVSKKDFVLSYRPK